jgi:hypothetical protein
MASTTINDYYSIGMDNNEIVLKVTIEHTQLSRSTVRLNKKLVGEYDDSFEVNLGLAKEIMGSILYVDTTESDVDPDSDMTSFVLELSGGPNPYKNQRAQTVPPGGYVLYTAELALIP